MQRQTVAVSFLRVVLVIALSIVVYVPLVLLVHRGNESHGHVYAGVFPVAWIMVILTSWLMARSSRKLSFLAVVLATASILLYYGLPRLAY